MDRNQQLLSNITEVDEISTQTNSNLQSNVSEMENSQMNNDNLKFQNPNYRQSENFDLKNNKQDLNEDLVILQEQDNDFDRQNDKNIMRVSMLMSKQFQDEAEKNQDQKKVDQRIDIMQQIKNLKNISTGLQKELEEIIQKIQRVFQFIQKIYERHHSNQEIIDKAKTINQYFIIFHQQFQQIINILNTEDDKEIYEIQKRYAYLQEFKIQVKSKEEVNLIILQEGLESIQKYLVEFLQVLKEFSQKKINIKAEEHTDSLFNDLKIIFSKFYTILETIPFTVKVEKDDIFCDKMIIVTENFAEENQNEQNKELIQDLQKKEEQKQEDPDNKWLVLNKYIHRKQLASEEQLKESHEKTIRFIKLAGAMVQKSSEYNNSFSKNVMKNMSALFYLANPDRAARKADIFQAEPAEENAYQTWNLLEEGMNKQMLRIAFPNLKHYKKIYIPRLYKKISQESIILELQNETLNKIDFVKEDQQIQFIENEEQFYKKELFEQESKQYQDKIQIRFLLDTQPFKLDSKQWQILENEKNLKENQDYNYTYLLQKQLKEQQNFFSKIFTNVDEKIYENIVIQIHGGGFVAMSSRSHQTYTRKWAQWLKIPIFCIDYRKAPKHPYPAALDDCWQAYNWILNYIKKFFNVVPKKIVLVGDSAGGNLVAALTARCIKHHVKVPDGILLVYPALNLNLKRFTPSHFIALDDPLLSHKVLKICSKAYLEVDGVYKIPPDQDPFISPIYLSGEILQKFPPTRMQVGTLDPLHDDCFRLLDRLLKLNKDVDMIVYNGLPHGFLNLDVPQGFKECAQCVIDASNYLKKLHKL